MMLDNVWFAIGLVVLLMFADYLLTIKGFRAYKSSGFSQYIKVESYELNPMFRKDISLLKYNPKHLFFVTFAVFSLYAFYQLGRAEITRGLTFGLDAFHLLQGALISGLGLVIGDHLASLIVFRTVSRIPGLMTGNLRETLLYSLYLKRAHQIGASFVFVLVFLFLPSYFTFGLLFGISAMALRTTDWIKKASKK